MRRILATIALAWTTFALQAQPNEKLFPAPYVISENQELPRTQFMSYRNQKDALEDNYEASQNYVSLQGEWYFKQFNSEAALPREITQGGDVLEHYVADWKKASVPALRHWGGINVEVYVNKLNVPFDLFDKAHFLHLGAVNGKVTVYVNGNKVGFSQRDFQSPVEFDITKYTAEGTNWVVLVVSRETPAYAVEGEPKDSGVLGDIYLFAQPKIRIRDYTVSTTLDPTYTNGLLETALLLKTQLLNPHTVTVYYDLYDPQGKLVNSAFRDIQVGLKEEDTVRFTASIPNVTKWNAETPELYTLLYRVKREGRFTEYMARKVGFRMIEIKGNELQVNGQTVKIHGGGIDPYLFQFSFETGLLLKENNLKEELIKLKRLGINALDIWRGQDDFYQLCNELGFYVFDIANVGNLRTNKYEVPLNIGNSPAWREVILERVNTQYERNKNHVSVIAWELGRASWNGYNMYQAYLLLKKKDMGRPIAYSGANLEWNTDIFLPSSVERSLKDIPLAQRPVIWKMCNKKEYWQNPGVQGGFINMHIEGSPEIFKEYYQAVVITAVDPAKGVYRFENRLQYTDLEQFTVEYELKQPGGKKAIKKGIINVSAAPGESMEVTVPGVGSVGQKGRTLTFTVGNIAQKQF